MSEPFISVLLPVYNAERYLKESIDSILNQTYRNFEFLILNDGSIDKSEEIIKSYSDSRIKYYKHVNCGLAATLNKGIELANGEIIARQDQDDISLPERFQKQIEFLNSNPSVLVLGTRARIFTDDGKIFGYHNHPTNPAVLKLDLMFNNPFVHSSVMFRKSALAKTGLYSTDKNYFEDYNLWSKMIQVGDVANLADVLVEYRHHEKSLSKGSSYFGKDALYLQCCANIETLIGEKNPTINDMIAIYHRQYEFYKGSSKKDMILYLQKIAGKVIAQHKNSEIDIKKRIKEYEMVLGYTFNIYQRELYMNNKLKMFFLILEMKLNSYYPNIPSA